MVCNRKFVSGILHDLGELVMFKSLLCVSFKFEMVQLMLMCLFEHQLQRLNSGFIHINFMFVLAADVICNRNILQI